MTTRIGTKGQVVIPKPVRDLARVHPGDEVDIVFDQDRIVIAPRRRADALGGRFAHSGMAARLLEDRRSEPR
jgi:AbrB family looped-hinge helix DNA binding protein